MSKAQTKTDNSHFIEKVELRCKALPPKKEITILDCFAGESKLWKKVKNLKGSKKTNIVSIDKKEMRGVGLRGDNRKYLLSMDLDRFDVIDLDSYGVPFSQLEILFRKKYKGVVIITFIQSLYGCLPRRLLYTLGYTKQMVDKCPTLFNINGFEKFCQYLAFQNIRTINVVGFGRKFYLYFQMA